jgi:hypothetical protein
MPNQRVPQPALVANPLCPTLENSSRPGVAQSPLQSLGLQDCGIWPKPAPRVASMLASIAVHVGLVSLLIHIPYVVRTVLGHEASPTANQVKRTVYVLRPLSLSEYFPTVRPAGLAGKPDQGSNKSHNPAIGSKAMDPRGLIVSAPLKPDNFRQTIVQPASPPELRIPSELKLPNVVTGNFPPPPPKETKPEVELPSQAVMAKLAVTADTSRSVPDAPPLSLKLPPLSNPHLEVPLPSPPSAPQLSELQGAEDRRVRESAALTDLGVQGSAPSAGRGLFSLSVDPAPATQLVELPPGNRFGAFTVAATAGVGSPGGVPGGEANGGEAGFGRGGDSSSGLGPGGKGGGGSGASGTEAVAVSSRLAGVPGGGALSPLSPASLVYPVAMSSRPRQSHMLVTSGPGGGGGLSVYGVLRGKKIYTIYLPMPGKNWILQYCEWSTDPVQHGAESSRSVAIRLDPGLVPPSVEEQFDFHRPALPTDKMTEMIVLHGVIRQDGSVAEVKALKGLEDLADEAAVAAFARWKFKPALRAGSAVAIEVLVGVPAM